ncbi:MAG: hypothetical protein GW775_01705 [Candidatus Magasanikbacteria bacterium]|nr:hypothetical protein [bacterium]NCS71966.1 hypothetical protein [Candidatus Magasanikbacteria bacterium]
MTTSRLPEFRTASFFDSFHSLNTPDHPASWQEEAFQSGWKNKPDFFDTLHRFSFGTMSIGDTVVNMTVLGTEDLAHQSWKQCVTQEVIQDIDGTLQHIAKQCASIHALREISFCMSQPINPENKQPANGYAPVSISQDHETGQSFETPSGVIILFPHVVDAVHAHEPYRGVIPELSHIQGIVTHEWVHQFMAAEGTSFCDEWLSFVPGWEYIQGKYVYTAEESLPTPYCSHNPVDDFVECMTIYLWQPELLEVNHPERFFFCKEFVSFLQESAGVEEHA